MSEIKLNSLVKNFGGNSLAVDNLSVTFPSGEFVCLLGPSGCGKTTTLRMIAGLERPDSGEIFCGDQTYFSSNTGEYLKTEKRNLGLMFQSYALWPHMTVFQNIVFGLDMKNQSSSEKEKRFEELEKLFQLKNLKNRYPSELSGGQQQRVAVARSLVFDPQLVLMDEPLGALDKNLRESMQYEIKHIHESIGVTVVYVTHDQSEALTMSNRIAVFNDGKVQQLSNPAELYEKPVNSFVAEFIGENNTFNGEVVDIAKDKCKVKLANSEILANPISVKSKGEKTTVSLRPERALINPIDKMDNMFTGKIEEVIYHGDHTRVRLNLLGSSEFILKVPNSTSNLELKVSQDINIGWNSTDARALDPK